MPFLSVSYTNFRNIKDGTIDFCYPEIFFVGSNGQGKSNILESLYMSSYGSSFRTRMDAEISRSGTREFSIRTVFRDDRERNNSFSYLFRNGKKRIEKNSRVINDRKELISDIPCVLFNHDDMDFVSGSPERRRFFIDQSLSMYDIDYVDILRKYKKILKSRNLILKEKEASKETLEILDFQFVSAGLEVMNRRKKAVWNFNWIFSKLYGEVSGIENVSINYFPSWTGDSVEQIVSNLQRKRGMEYALGTSMSGPHRDKIIFMKDKTDFVNTSSMGQRRLLALLLRVSQAVFYTEQTEKLPVLLMDDVLLELDPEKRKKFTSVLPEYDQLFCTFLPGEPYENYGKSKTKIYEIKEGSWNG